MSPENVLREHEEVVSDLLEVESSLHSAGAAIIRIPYSTTEELIERKKKRSLFSV